MNTRAVGITLLAVVALSACAPGRSVHRGNWPDGRIETAPRTAMAPMAPRPVAADPAAEEWLAAEPTDSGMHPEQLNRDGVLQATYFRYDSASIEPDQRATLDQNAIWLRENPRARIIIEGHCDERGTRRYNLALGQRRAEAARDYLVALGIAGHRLEVVSYGEELPTAMGHDEAAWAANRRAEFVIVATQP